MEKNKIGALIAAACLVGLLVVASIAYRTLSAATTNGEPPAAGTASGTTQATGEEGTQPGAVDDAAASEATASDATTPDDAIYLADHDATVYAESGEAHTLTELADGRPLVINFWATWCPYCVQEMPDYKEIYDEYADRVAFAFVDVADGSRETVEDAADWLFQNELFELPAYYDTDLEATTAFGAYSLPTTAVVAADGEILTISAGAIDPTLMRASLESIL